MHGIGDRVGYTAYLGMLLKRKVLFLPDPATLNARHDSSRLLHSDVSYRS